jgi:hypothetical protein
MTKAQTLSAAYSAALRAVRDKFRSEFDGYFYVRTEENGERYNNAYQSAMADVRDAHPIVWKRTLTACKHEYGLI